MKTGFHVSGIGMFPQCVCLCVDQLWPRTVIIALTGGFSYKQRLMKMSHCYGNYLLRGPGSVAELILGTTGVLIFWETANSAPD